MFSKVWKPPPDQRYTWAQAPIKFEDALGRITPVPSEHDWDVGYLNLLLIVYDSLLIKLGLTLEIQTQFKLGPGHAKVRSCEYELFSGLDDLNAIKASNFCPVPRMSITMAFIMGQYARLPTASVYVDVFRARWGGLWQNLVRYIHLQVKSVWFNMLSISSLKCNCWFRKSRASLPKPMKPYA